MNRHACLTAILLLCIMLSLSAQENSLRLMIVYDNYPAEEQFASDWGFACLVEYQGNRLLFDAGRKTKLYEKNMAQLGIDPADSPALFISHHHGDHTAGMSWICAQNPGIACFLPATFYDMLKEENHLPPNSRGFITPEHLFGPYYTTGDGFEAFREQGLVIKTASGGVLVTGCGHPGALEMIEVAQDELGIPIHTLIGGLHLMQHSDAQLKQLEEGLKNAGVKQICATHCTGDHAMAYLKQAFGEGFITGGSGKEIIIQ
jgi:7,8-dihydropterin-6-yl-methyl-4-(beta-D-ribofuranosyl)aminobenzene 5'-phosphate synthase